MDNIYEIRESITTERAIPDAARILVQSFKDAGYKPVVDDTKIHVKTGSNIWLRLWGTMLPWGRSSVPVGTTITLKPAGTGSIAEVHAYDRLGWYLDAKSNPVLKEESERKMNAFSRIVRDALK